MCHIKFCNYSRKVGISNNLREKYLGGIDVRKINFLPRSRIERERPRNESKYHSCTLLLVILITVVTFFSSFVCFYFQFFHFNNSCILLFNPNIKY